VVPRRAESILLHEPARWEDDEVGDGGADVVGGAGQDGEDAGIGVVVADAADGVEAAQVVLEGVVGSVPGNDVERRVLLGRREESAVELCEDSPVVGGVFVEASNGSLEVARVGKTVGADRAEFRELEMSLVQLKDVAADGAFWQGDAIADAARDNGDLIWSDEEVAELGLDVEDTVLQDDEEVPIGGVVGFVAHVLAGCEDEDAETGFRRWAACASEIFERMDPVLCNVHVEGIPAKLVWDLVQWCLQMVLGGGVDLAGVCGEIAMRSGWKDAIEP